MKVRQSILDQINNVESRRKIGERLGIADQMVYIHIKKNAVDGPLTKMKALQAISEVTEIPVMEILEDDNKEEDKETMTDAAIANQRT